GRPFVRAYRPRHTGGAAAAAGVRQGAAPPAVARAVTACRTRTFGTHGRVLFRWNTRRINPYVYSDSGRPRAAVPPVPALSSRPPVLRSNSSKRLMMTDSAVMQLPDAISALHTLALNLRWSWHAPTRDLFARIDADLWRATGSNPVRLLQEVDAARL